MFLSPLYVPYTLETTFQVQFVRMGQHLSIPVGSAEERSRVALSWCALLNSVKRRQKLAVGPPVQHVCNTPPLLKEGHKTAERGQHSCYLSIMVSRGWREVDGKKTMSLWDGIWA